MISIVIPSVGEKTLEKTVAELLDKAGREIEIIIIFDGVEAREVQGATSVPSEWMGMRGAINKGMGLAKGDYVMKTDEHCLFGKNFDVELLSSIEDNWIVTPRRLWLDIKKWEIMERGRLPADYERLLISDPNKIGGCRWDGRTAKRMHVPIDETMLFQGSCYLMHRKHWDWLGGLQEEGYGPFANEAVEICLKTWLGGGKVVVNKNTWYAHKHRSFGRHSKLKRSDVDSGNKYSRDFWINNRWKDRVHDLSWLMSRFGLSI